MMEPFGDLDFSSVWKYREPLLWGLWTTVWMTVVAFTLAVPSGLLLAMGRLRGGWLVNLPIMAFVDLMRFTPLLVQAVWIHFALPVVTGASLTATQSAVLALTLHVSAYVCDVMRAGITAIPKGQWEAARALGLNPRHTFLDVILPQVWPLVLPPLANVAVSTFKLTAILGILAVDDLMKVANRVNNMVFRPVELYTSAALAYLAVGLLLTAGAMWVERRYGAERIERLARREAARPRPIRTAPQDL
jgi:polar amino acid transport system permease protein